MKTPLPGHLATRILDRINASRFWSISLLIHVVVVILLGGTVLFKAIQEDPNFKVGEGDGFVQKRDEAHRPDVAQQPPSDTPAYNPIPDGGGSISPLQPIITDSPIALENLAPIHQGPITQKPNPNNGIANPTADQRISTDGLSPADLAKMAEFANWTADGSRPSGSQGLRVREYKFVAFIGKYSGGNWNSTVTVEGGDIVRGSLPNLLYLASAWSNGKIQTNERDVQAIALDSDQIFSERPPFIFITGSRDFQLTDREVENLRRYIRLGGAIWGDSSVPGKNSRFDIAFRREMKRVIPDVDKDWEAIPSNHPIFTAAYFPEIKAVPPGVNFYSEPIYALKHLGEIAIFYTANDYGDMWQIGLTKEGEPDFSKNARGQSIAMNDILWRYRDVYLGNLDAEPVSDSFKFGINIITHLLTRWDDKLRTAPRL